ncbi:MAG: FtsX-like permease family protein [Myxococcota bacterium]
MLILKLAWRNLGRNRRRTILTAIGITVGYALTIFYMGMGEGMYRQMIDDGVRSQAGHIVVQGRGFQDERSSRIVVPDVKRVAAAVAALDANVVAVERLIGEGILKWAGRSAGVVFMGVDENGESKQSLLPKKLEQGRYIAADDPSGIYVGSRLAERLGIGLGDPAVLMAQAIDGETNQRRYRIRGIFETGVGAIDGHLMHLPLAEAQAFLGTDGGVTQVALFFDSEEQGRALAPVLREALADETLEVLAWDEAMPDLAGVVALDKAGFYVYMIIVFIIVAFSILNTILMSVLERVHEFGVMLAVGMRPGQVMRLVVAEGAILGFACLIIGSALVLPVNAYYAANGMDITAMLPGGEYEVAGVSVNPLIYFHTPWLRVAVCAACVFALTVLISAYPAAKAARLNPIEAINQP